MKLRKVDDVHMFIDCDAGQAAELNDYFTFEVPNAKFTPSYRNGFWDGKIRLFDTRKRQLYYGLYEYVKKFCESADYELQIDESITFGDHNFSDIDCTRFAERLNLNLTPRDYQLQAVRHCINMDRCLLLSPTASGKSFIIYLLLRYYNTRSLIVVPTVSLTQQMYTDFQEYGDEWDVAKHCHLITAGAEKETDKQVVISTWQSIYNMPRSYFNEFEFMIGDEAHLFKAKSLTSVMSKLKNCRWKFGTTGTLDDSQTHKLVLEGLFGPVHQVTSTSDLIDAGYLAKFDIQCLILKYSEQEAMYVKKLTYQDEIEFLVTHEKRNRFIRNLACDQRGNTLLLFQYVDKHGRVLHDMIQNKVDKDRKVFFVYGGVDGSDREEIRRITERESNAIIVASFGTFSTGINIRNLHNIIFASPSKSKVRNLQSIGRGLRKGDKKNAATLYDIADDLSHRSYINYTLKHFKERISQYNEQQFKYRMFHIGF
ncbi:MAG: UvsW [Porticoccaceae bacterium]|nr:UvsW [Porticoccaceae bacterium]|tara:strand:- start:973 stop:2421 length:1449 start_codon:yes stop_codon:yes gene_type:complete